MESIKTKGLIIKSSDYGEANCMITVFTENMGIVSAGVYGARSKKRGLGASSRIFTFGEFLFKNSGGRLRVEEIAVREGFFPLCEDIVKLSAAVYFADLAYAAVGMHNKDNGVFRLLLNTIYALCYNDIDSDVVKTVFEFRLAAEGGYLPVLDLCAACECEPQGEIYFDIERGGILCESCRRPGSIKLTTAAHTAIKYILSAEDKKILSFKADNNVIALLANISEQYISEHLDRKFKSLDYYKKIKGSN
ncbi:MAG: DNA repair protein RecO [Eubacteriales bacterium]|nr:DNA repair protein RecO [Eubacteriales bacterium]